MTFAYFDLETTGVDADTCDFTCGVLVADNGPVIFYTAVEMVTFMQSHPEFLYVTFNGLSFDFRVLAAQCVKAGKPALATFVAETAISDKHVDIMFAFTVEHGYFASMDSFAVQLGFKKSWNGAEAAASTDLKAIVAYCTTDVDVLKKIHKAAVELGYLLRASKMGRLLAWVLPHDGPLSVPKVLVNLTAAKPDQSWMTTPPKLPGGQMKWAQVLLA